MLEDRIKGKIHSKKKKAHTLPLSSKRLRSGRGRRSPPLCQADMGTQSQYISLSKWCGNAKSFIKPCLDENVDDGKVLPRIVEDLLFDDAALVAVFHSPSIELSAVVGDVIDSEEGIAQVRVVRS